MKIWRQIPIFCLAVALLPAIALAQETPSQPERPSIRLNDRELPPEPAPETPPQPEAVTPNPDQSAEELPEAELEGVLNTGPDYSQLSETEEKTLRLDELFARLKLEADTDAAKLIAEEIWALWLDSGSASVDMLLLRGTAFEKRGAVVKARAMYNHVTSLMPDYAEGWARSARLAVEEEDYGRALSDAAQALILEPREFYALWTMGNVFEKLGRAEEAYQAYTEALVLYPEHPAIKDRVGVLQSKIDGNVL